MDSKNVSLKPLDWIIIVLFASFIIVTPVWIIKGANNDRLQHTNQIKSLYGGISFVGKVVCVHYIKHSGMPLETVIMCIKIDSSNTDSFYQFDKYTAFKIENGVATLPIGLFDKTTEDTLYEDVVRVIINESGSHKALYITEKNDTIVDSLCYTSVGLKEYDLNICDTCF